jgi:hydrogenase maturation protease
LTAAGATELKLKPVLVIGYGNPGRRDDGLGPALAERLEAAAPAGVSVDSDYQLMIEDAAEVACHEVTIFADASVSCPEPYLFRAVEPREDASFSTHSVSPEAVVHLAGKCFDCRPRAYVLEIRGYDFDGFGEGLSSRAEHNLSAAAGFLADRLRAGDFEAAAARGGSSAGQPETARARA